MIDLLVSLLAVADVATTPARDILEMVANDGLAIVMVVVLILWLLNRANKIIDAQQKAHALEISRMREDSAKTLSIVEANTRAFVQLQDAIARLSEAINQCPPEPRK